jgi:hypothetical protein
VNAKKKAFEAIDESILTRLLHIVQEASKVPSKYEATASSRNNNITTSHENAIERRSSQEMYGSYQEEGITSFSQRPNTTNDGNYRKLNHVENKKGQFEMSSHEASSRNNSISSSTIHSRSNSTTASFPSQLVGRYTIE